MNVLVLGAALSGVAAARLACRLGDEVTVYDAVPAEIEGCDVIAGPWSPGVLTGRDLVVTSPGFGETSPPIRDTLARGIPLWSEVEFAFRHLSAPLVGVTGTNGKTTVTTLVSDMLTASGLRAPAVGNIGTPLCDLVGVETDVLVVELSSFQLRFIDTLAVRVAVVTNVATDHLDWHVDLASYEAAKRRIVENQGSGDLLVVDGDDPGATRIAAHAPGRVSSVRLGGRPVGLDGGVVRAPGVEIPLGDLSVADTVFVLDVLLAAVAALDIGASPEAVTEAARAFVPAPHRRRVVNESDGVRFVDDSKATNPHAALAALDAYPSVVLIAGGQAKGLDVTPLARHPHVRRVVAIGEAAPDLVAAGGDRVERAGSMEEAVAAAWAAAEPGDVVLLAPGCASFDQFENYGARGDAFARAVESILERRGT